MTESSAQNSNPSSANFAALSVLIPGSGQYFQKKQFRGVIVLISAVICGFLVYWGYDHFNIAKITIGSFSTSWLWLPFAGFWIWNILDAFQIRVGKAFSVLPAVLFAAIILYVIAWNATDVKLDRLITRIDAAAKVGEDLVNPDIFAIGKGANAQRCSWDCLGTFLSDKLTGKPAKDVQFSDNVGDIFGKTVSKVASNWQITLGLAKPGEKVGTYETGKLIETIALGIMATLFSTILAIPISFLAARNVMSKVPGGMVIYYIARTILNVVRAIDTVVWGLLVIVWVGLGTFAGVIALTIHSVAALGKLYSEEIEHIDEGPVEAITASGGNFLQVIRYAIIPQIIPSFLGYTLLRWDINMRSATVVGFVAGGGIGFFVLETIRQGAYQQYAAALWAVAVVIIIVDYVSEHWRANILKDQPREEVKKTNWTKLRTVLYVVLGAAFFIYCWNITEINLKDLFNPGKTFGRLIHDFISVDLTPSIVNSVGKEMIITVLQALLATSLGAIVATPFSFLAAKNLTGKSKVSAWLYYITRAVFNVLRSIEALLYAAIFVFWVGIGPFAGMLALAITTFALIGKLFSEAIENIEDGPIEAINATGANRMQMIRYAILPQIVPPFVSYLVYQWDINIRMATIIGFAGGGGIGLTLSTYFGSLQYHKAGTVILFIVVVVALMDLASAELRKRLV
jgi:phosphonate transport system permease protein